MLRAEGWRLEGWRLEAGGWKAGGWRLEAGRLEGWKAGRLEAGRLEGWRLDFRIDILAGELIKKKNSHETGLGLTVFNSNYTILHRILIRIQWWYQNRLSSHMRQILKNAQIQRYHP